jgi:hypothetical protein
MGKKICWRVFLAGQLIILLPYFRQDYWGVGSTSNNTELQKTETRVYKYIHVSNRLLPASDNMASAMDKVITLDYISVSE